MRFLFAIVLLGLAGCSHEYSMGSSIVGRTTDNVGDIEIYGGEPAKIEDFPFMAALSDDEQGIFCGASIVKEQFLVTAAHCFYGTLDIMTAKVIVGTDKVSGGEQYRIKDFLSHPEFDLFSMTMDFDMAVIQLETKLKLSTKVQSVKMSTAVPKEGDVYDALGFGSLGNSDQSNDLRKVKLPYIDQKTCQKEASSIVLTQRMICAGKDGKDTCMGDSGGPLILDNELIGVTSFGTHSGCGHFAGVYSSVPALRSFIDEVIQSHS